MLTIALIIGPKSPLVNPELEQHPEVICGPTGLALAVVTDLVVAVRAEAAREPVVVVEVPPLSGPSFSLDTSAAPTLDFCHHILQYRSVLGSHGPPLSSVRIVTAAPVINDLTTVYVGLYVIRN